MGRTLKLVPLDFQYQFGKVWVGYINPFRQLRLDCPACEGKGYGPEARVFSDQWYGLAPFDPVAYGATPLTRDHPAIIQLAQRNVSKAPHYYGTGVMGVQREIDRLFYHFHNQWSHHLIQADVDALVAHERLGDFTKRPRTPEQEEKLKETGGYWLREWNGYTPTADEVNAWSLEGMGHDAINQYCCVEARCEREGVVMLCQVCEGEGEAWARPEDKVAFETWEPYDPPEGEGYQLWETTSEGSPKSPVFKTLDELCGWCADHATTFADFKATAEEWRDMLDKDNVHARQGHMIFL